MRSHPLGHTMESAFVWLVGLAWIVIFMFVCIAREFFAVHYLNSSVVSGNSSDDTSALVRVPEPLGNDVLASFQDGADELSPLYFRILSSALACSRQLC